MNSEEQKAEGDNLAKQLGDIKLDDAESAVEESTGTVSLDNMHFTNGDWRPKQKPKKRVQSTDEVEQTEGGSPHFEMTPEQKEEFEKLFSRNAPTEGAFGETKKEEEEDDGGATLEDYPDENSGEIPTSFFQILCRECSKVPYTPEEQQARRNEGHVARNDMLLEGIQKNHREWIYQIEELLALERMNDIRKQAKKAAKEERRRAEAEAVQ